MRRLLAATIASILPLAACPPTAAVSQPRGGAGGTHDGGLPDDAGAPDGDAGGELVVRWKHWVGDGQAQSSQALALDSTGAVLWGGKFNGKVDFRQGTVLSAGADADGFVAKISPAGEVHWVRQIAGSAVRPNGLAAAASGPVTVSGRFTGTVAIDDAGLQAPTPGAQIGFAYDLSESGAPTWDMALTVGDGHSNATDVAMDATGALVLTGNFAGQVDFGGGPLTSNPVTGTNLFLAKLGPSPGRQHVWSTVIGSTGGLIWSKVGVDPSSGDVAVLTQKCPAQCTGALLRRLDPADAGARWEKTVSADLGAQYHAVAVGPSGEVVIAGALESSGLTGLGCKDVDAATGMRAFVARLEADGSCAFARPFGGSGDTAASAVAVAPNGAVVVAGVFAKTLDLWDGRTLHGGGGGGIFVAEIAYDGSDWKVRRADPFPHEGDVAALDVAGVASDGEAVFVAGTLGGSLQIGTETLVSGGDSDAFVAAIER